MGLVHLPVTYAWLNFVVNVGKYTSVPWILWIRLYALRIQSPPSNIEGFDPIPSNRNGSGESRNLRTYKRILRVVHVLFTCHLNLLDFRKIIWDPMGKIIWSSSVTWRFSQSPPENCFPPQASRWSESVVSTAPPQMGRQTCTDSVREKRNPMTVENCWWETEDI